MARPIANDHDDKRSMILRSAARLFADEGYGRASMSALAAACGISKANIYHYYPSKEALLFDILDTHLRGLRDRVCGLTFHSNRPDAQLHQILGEMLLAYQGADAEHEVQLNAITTLPENQQEVLRTYQRDLVDVVRTRLAQIAPPEIAQDRTKLRSLTMSIFAMINWYYQWNTGAGAEARKDYARLVADLVVGGAPNLGTDHNVTR